MRYLSKFTKNRIKWIIFSLLAVAFAVTQISYVMYPAYIIQLTFLLFGLNKNSKIRKREMIDMLLVSLMMPDNYLIILSTLLIFFLSVCISTKKANHSHITAIVITLIYLFYNILFNVVPFGNIIMAVVYLLPFVLLEDCCNQIFEKDSNIVLQISSSIKKMILIEAVATIVYAITHISTVLTYQDMDWVTGTLGEYQCNVLMVICTFSLLIFWAEYTIYKNSNLKWILLAGGLALSTGAVAYTLMFVFSVLLVTMFSLKTSINKKIALIALLIIGSIAFVVIVPEWMSREILMLTNSEYLLNRVTKLKFYKSTFFEIPKNEGFLSFLFGTGLGQYTSRAAETCAGGYVGLYDQIANGFETAIRKRYISGVSYGGAGLTASPASSIMSLQGELGFIALVFVVVFFARKAKKGKQLNSVIAVVYFISLMIVDNALEFAKYGAIFWITYYACKNIKCNIVRGNMMNNGMEIGIDRNLYNYLINQGTFQTDFNKTNIAKPV